MIKPKCQIFDIRNLEICLTLGFRHLTFLQLTLCILVLVSCDNSNWVLYRASNDYFPLKNGNKWKYDTQGITTLIEVKGDTVVYNQSCKHLQNNFADEYWIKDNGNVSKLYLRTIDHNGTDYILENSWLLQYKLPFVLDNFWSDVFSDTVLILGITYHIQQTIERKVVEINDVNIPAGTFFQTYKIEFIESFTLNDSTEHYSGYEWFAPGVGLIKKISNNIEEVLIDYSEK